MARARLRRAKVDGVVGGGVAGVQGGDDVELIGQVGRLGGIGRAEVEKVHALKAQPGGKLAGALHQLGPRFYAPDAALPARLAPQVIKHEAQIGLARAVVGQQRPAGSCGQIGQFLFDELQQVIDLLELAARVLIDAAFAGEDVQLLQQRQRLAGAQAQLGMQIRMGGRRGRCRSGGFRGACRGFLAHFFVAASAVSTRVSAVLRFFLRLLPGAPRAALKCRRPAGRECAGRAAWGHRPRPHAKGAGPAQRQSASRQ